MSLREHHIILITKVVCALGVLNQQTDSRVGHYCRSKAGVDMLAQTVALEQQAQEHPVESVPFNPGH